MSINKYFDWIRSQPCFFQDRPVLSFLSDTTVCKNYPRTCRQEWDMDKGLYRSEVSHILRRRSVRLKEGENHYGNVFPNCSTHHIWFEGLPPEVREEFKEFGANYYDQYKAQRF